MFISKGFRFKSPRRILLTFNKHIGSFAYKSLQQALTINLEDNQHAASMQLVRVGVSEAQQHGLALRLVESWLVLASSRLFSR